MSARLFDTGASSPAPLAPGIFEQPNKWTALPEDTTHHAFKGDAVLTNDRLAVVLRRKGRGAEVYAKGAKGLVLRAELVPAGGAPATSLTSVKITENTQGGVSVDATYKAAKGGALTLGFELKLGQVFVQTEPRANVTALRVFAPGRFAVLPDFFADDIVADATTLAVAETELPSENFLLHLVGDGDAIVMPVWHPAQDDVRINPRGQGPSPNHRQFRDPLCARRQDLGGRAERPGHLA